MTLVLNNGTEPNELDVKTGFFMPDQVRIGDYYVSMADFCELTMYVLTNTNLIGSDDPRLKLIERIKALRLRIGYNNEGQRLSDGR